jgi:hypothetical protein
VFRDLLLFGFLAITFTDCKILEHRTQILCIATIRHSLDYVSNTEVTDPNDYYYTKRRNVACEKRIDAYEKHNISCEKRNIAVEQKAYHNLLEAYRSVDEI